MWQGAVMEIKGGWGRKKMKMENPKVENERKVREGAVEKWE